MKKTELLIIGAGPGGYAAAIRAGQLGMKTLCVDERALPGGTCLHIGCIPSKALLFATEMGHFFQHDAAQFGITAQDIQLDFAKMQARSKSVVDSLTHAVADLFKQHKVDYISGKAAFFSEKLIKVNNEEIEANKIILATGSYPTPLPFLPFDEKIILSSTGALALDAPPASLIVIGGGIIGLEMASIFARLGTQVTVVELLDEVAFTIDHEIARGLRTSLMKLGIKFSLSTQATGADILEKEIVLKTNKGSFSAEKVLVAIGRKPNTQSFAIEKTKAQTDSKGFIRINRSFETDQPGLYAIGDLVNGPMLAHKAEEEGVAAVDLMCGKKGSVDLFSIPSIIYTYPEAASCGFTEKEARALWSEKGRDLMIGKFPLRALGRAKAMGVEEGLVKLIADKKSRKLIGLHLLAPFASEMIHVGAIALRSRMTVDQLKECSFAHPTLSEGIKEVLRANF
jgi:dihydrolipoamide dehydrogenase